MSTQDILGSCLEMAQMGISVDSKPGSISSAVNLPWPNEGQYLNTNKEGRYRSWFGEGSNNVILWYLEHLVSMSWKYAIDIFPSTIVI